MTPNALTPDEAAAVAAALRIASILKRHRVWLTEAPAPLDDFSQITYARPPAGSLGAEELEALAGRIEADATNA